MSHDQELQLLAAYSRSEISRAEIERQSGEELTFGALIEKLRKHKLTLPVTPSDPQSRGVQLVRSLAVRAAHG
jgi:hypothetical protein